MIYKVKFSYYFEIEKIKIVKIEKTCFSILKENKDSF
jgi:hypothetical protein